MITDLCIIIIITFCLLSVAWLAVGSISMSYFADTIVRMDTMPCGYRLDMLTLWHMVTWPYMLVRIYKYKHKTRTEILDK